MPHGTGLNPRGRSAVPSPIAGCRLALGWIALSVVVFGCTTVPSPTSVPFTALPTPSKTPPLPSATPTPAVELSVHEQSLLQGETSGEWTMVGLVSARSSENLYGVWVRLTLEDDAHRSLADGTVPLLMPHLLPGEYAPFVGRFKGVPSATTGIVGLESFQYAAFRRERVEVEVQRRLSTREGGLAIVGNLTNAGDQTIALEGFGFLARDSSGSLRDVAVMRAGLRTMTPGQTSPFLALFDRDPGPVDLTPFQDAIRVDGLDEVAVSLLEPPRLQTTSQGYPFVVGTIRNDDSRPRQVTWMTSLSLNGEPVTLTQLQSPFPLQPGEQLDFGVREFPGLERLLREGGLDIGDLQVEVVVEPAASADVNRMPVALTLEIQGFEQIGSSVFLRGDLTNPRATRVERPTVLGAIRTTGGTLVTAGWVEVAENLQPGETAPFVIDLPLPRRADLLASEFDFTAVGLTPR